ncbi:MAG: EAL domain-containing protein [Ancalomicrobiaceae bacterium]|nr:EAL domain-containing protein [Ancalomicrobiaceae bacterium]
MFKRILDLFRLPTDNMDVVRSQLSAFVHQVPLLYFLLAANSIVVAWTHSDVAPPLLSIGACYALCLICSVRLFQWLQDRKRNLPDKYAARRLRTIRVMTVVLLALFFAWVGALYVYGDLNSREHLAFYVAITVNTICICLLQVRSSAFVAISLSAIVFVAMFGFSGDKYLIGITLNQLFSVIVLAYTINIHYGSFVDLIQFKGELIRQNGRMQKLSDDNFKIANHDVLTGLPNRRYFFARLRDIIGRKRQEGGSFILGLVDLDGFKPVNDVYGHHVGDALLIEAAARLTMAAGSGTFVARLGGDEFALIIPEPLSDEDLLVRSRAISSALQAPFEIDGAVAKVSASCGFAAFPDAGRSDSELYDRADHALYHAKAHQRGGAVVFSSEHELEIRREAHLEQVLRRADISREFSLAFQPILSSSTGQVVAFEALARWTSPSIGSISPGLFIPVAEKVDLIGDITLELFGQALDRLAEWPESIGLSFNLSARDIASASTIMKLILLVTTRGANPKRIDFEITETMLMQDFNLAVQSIQALRLLGCGIVLDDFGTGYSSLAYVHRLSPSKIKVDRSFTLEMSRDPQCRTIVQSIVGLCDNIGVDCVVEGVETEEQARIAGELGCDLMQGYYFAQPMGAPAIPSYLAQIAGIPVKVCTRRHGGEPHCDDVASCPVTAPAARVRREA